MTTTLLSLPGAEWLLNPIGVGALAAVLAVVLTGLLGRVVLFLETILPARAARRPRPAVAARRRPGDERYSSPADVVTAGN